MAASDDNVTSASPPPSAGDDPHKLAPFNPSSETAQRQSIAMMNLVDNDVLFDLGCGDGRLLIRVVSQQIGAQNVNVRCVGVEIDPVFVERAQQAIAQLDAAIQERIQVRCQDVNSILSLPKTTEEAGNDPKQQLQQQDKKKKTMMDDLTIDDATVIYLYLLPRGLRHIKPMLDYLVKRRIQSGGSLRVVAYTFSVPGWEPVRVDTSTKSGVPIYLYQFS